MEDDNKRKQTAAGQLGGLLRPVVGSIQKSGRKLAGAVRNVPKLASQANDAAVDFAQSAGIYSVPKPPNKITPEGTPQMIKNAANLATRNTPLGGGEPMMPGTKPNDQMNVEFMPDQDKAIPGTTRGNTVGAPRPRGFNDGRPEGSITVMKGTDVFYTDPDNPETLLPAIPGASLQELREAHALQNAGYAAGETNRIDEISAKAQQQSANAQLINAQGGNAIQGFNQPEEGEEAKLGQYVPDGKGGYTLAEGVTPLAAPPTNTDKYKDVKIGSLGEQVTIKSRADGSQENVNQSIINEDIIGLMVNYQGSGMGYEEARAQAEADVSKKYNTQAVLNIRQ